MSRGELQAAQVLLQETEKLIAHRIGEDGLAVLDACQARLHMKANRPDEVKAWMRRRPAAGESALDMRKMYEYSTRLRAFIFLRQLRQGIAFGEMLLHMSESWFLHYYIAEIGLLLATLYETGGERPSAVRLAENALDIGQKEGYVQFLADWDIAEPVLRLFDKHVRAKPQTVPKAVVSYCERLLQLTAEQERVADPMRAARKRLTVKEYEVLLALIAGKTNADIAEQTSIRIETVKTHCKNIYKKLELKGRKEAAERFAGHAP